MLTLPAIIAIAVAIFGLFGAYVAVQKDRSLYEGFVFGSLLGPIGMLIVALLPDGARIAASRRSSARSEVSEDLPWLNDPARVVGRGK